jgi:hypothetical protein
MSPCNRIFQLALVLALAAPACTSNGGAAGDAGPTEGSAIATDAAASAGDGGDGGVNDGAPLDGSGSSDGRMSDGGGTSAPVCGPFAIGGGGPGDAGGQAPSPTMSFFVTSQKNTTGNLGGLTGADARCQSLAAAVGLGSKTWHAYLSVEHDAANANGPTNARDRIGAGPWFNAKGAMLAADVASLHARSGDPAVFIDEHGNMINGQWTGSPPPVEHDVLTGSNADGTLAPGKTCLDWTSQSAAITGAADGGELGVARVGHADGFGPMCNATMTPINYTSWSSVHDNAGCDNTAPRGGAGRIYCFAVQ